MQEVEIENKTFLSKNVRKINGLIILVARGDFGVTYRQPFQNKLNSILLVLIRGTLCFLQQDKGKPLQ